MFIGFTRVLVGLAIALFHGQVADFLRKQDGALAATFRERGLPIPGALPKQVSRDLFFLFGIAITLFSLAQMWLTLR